MDMQIRKFYRKVVQVEILSETEIADILDLDTIHYEITNGAWSGMCSIVESTEHTGKEMAALLQKQGTDTEFFQITEDGELIDE